MYPRYLSVSVIGVTLLVVLSGLSTSAAGQPPRSSSGASIELTGLAVTTDSSTLPRTPWDQPDLRGVWNNSTDTPLEDMTAAERERGQLAQAPVRRATDWTGAGWLELGGALERPSLIVDPADGRIRMQPDAVKRLVAREQVRFGRGESDSWLDRNSWERCISRTLPIAMIPNIYNANYQILQTPDYFVIVMEMIHETPDRSSGRPAACGRRHPPMAG